MIYNLFFASDTILSCFVFLIIDLCYLITAIVGQIFIWTARASNTYRNTSKEANWELETHPVTAESKIFKRST